MKKRQKAQKKILHKFQFNYYRKGILFSKKEKKKKKRNFKFQYRKKERKKDRKIKIKQIDQTKFAPHSWASGLIICLNTLSSLTKAVLEKTLVSAIVDG